MGGELLTRCDELWVMGSAIFSGMREEMELAKKLYMPIFYVSDEMVQTGYNLSSRNLIWDVRRIGLVVPHNGVND